MQYNRWRLGILVALVMAGTVGMGPATPIEAQVLRCFPQTNYCLSGVFYQYWEQNGGLTVFGYPITGVRPERNRDTGRVYLTQWFERNRFELHASGQILLGRLGDDRLRQLGINWQQEPRAVEQPGCRYFEQTGHNVCDQGEGIGFATYWMNHGLHDPKLDEYAQNLALFGLPLTEARMETNAAGDTVLTQWFERARFEWHPGNPDEFKVLLGLLGREVGPPFIAPRATPRGRDCPETHPIKGNVNARGERIYHVPGSRYYDETTPEVCFLTVEEAEAAGFRPSQR